MEILSKLFLPAVIFLFTLVFGVWLSHAGKPYNGILFNIHKLLALAAVIITVAQLANVLKTAGPHALISVLLFLAGICIVALFASGALMSMGKLSYALMLAIHRVAPALVAIAMGVVVYLLNGNRP